MFRWLLTKPHSQLIHNRADFTALTRHGFPAERMWHLQVVNSQNAGLLPFLPAAADEYDPVSGAKLKPFLLLVGCQAVLYVAAFLLSRGNGRVAKSKDA